MLKKLLIILTIILPAQCVQKKNDSDHDQTNITYYRHTEGLFKAKCSGCHVKGGVAFSLANYQEVYKHKRDIESAVTSRRMPVWLAKAGHQKYYDDPTLTDREMEIFKRWFALGAPAGDPKESSLEAVHPTLEDLNPDVKFNVLGEGHSYLPNQSRSDDYRCFMIDWPDSIDEEFITGLQVIPGNRRVAHHLVAYYVEQSKVEALHYLDAQEEGLGYQCFGGATPDRLNDEAVQADVKAKFPDFFDHLKESTFWIGHWAPGMRGNKFPKDSGIHIRKGGAVVIQMHYFTGFAPKESDANTQLLITLAPEVKYPGMFWPFSKDKWLDSRNNHSMVIPAGKQATFSYREAFAKVRQEAKERNVIQGDFDTVEIHSANLHMHSYGTSAKTDLLYGNGKIETLLEIDEWDLNWQRDFTLMEPIVLRLADAADTQLKVTCTYDNPSDKDVYGGFGSDDEMCFNFSYLLFK